MDKLNKMDQRELQVLLASLIATWENEVVEFKQAVQTARDSFARKYANRFSEGEVRNWPLFPIIYELCCQDQVKLTAAYKRPSEADAEKWVVDDFPNSSWLPADTERALLPVALDLGRLYDQLLRILLPIPGRPGESLKAQLERYAKIQRKEKERSKLEARLHQEKQFNRKAEINAQFRTVQQELENFTSRRMR